MKIFYRLTEVFIVGKVKDKTRSIHSAIEKGMLDEIKTMLQQGADVNQPDEDGTTPIQVAAKAGDLDIFSHLLNAGAAVDTPDNKGRTALTEASKRGHADIVRMLLDKGADPVRADVKDATPFHMASKKGHGEIVKMLIDAGADTLLTKANYKGYTPLHEAARKGKTKLAMRYVKMGADIDAPDIHGNRPAILAHAFGYPKLAKKLGKLNKAELAESQKIQNIEIIKEGAKQIAVDKAAGENRLVSKAETKNASKAALDTYFENQDSGKSFEELKIQAFQAATNSLLTQE